MKKEYISPQIGMATCAPAAIFCTSGDKLNNALDQQDVTPDPETIITGAFGSRSSSIWDDE